MICSLVSRNLPVDEKFDLTQRFFRKMAGEQKIGFNNSIFLSEKGTADRNRALTYFMVIFFLFLFNFILF